MPTQMCLMSALLTSELLVFCFVSTVGRAYVTLSTPVACKQDVGQEVTSQGLVPVQWLFDTVGFTVGYKAANLGNSCEGHLPN